MRQAFSRVLRHLVPTSKVMLAALLTASFTLSAGGDADAAKRKPKAQGPNPRYAAIVVDANTGKTLFAANAEARRYPASLTKMMTLYLTFEALDQGRIKKTTPVPFSAQAAAEPPTKMGVRAGGSMPVEGIILSLVTKSANDSARAMGELLGGSQDGFARMMTAKAKQLGMRNTVFRNASGLPNPDQHTTARDMAVLGLALREHFPKHYDYFSTRSFAWGKQRIGNHNRLLGRIRGVDGIKTGYTRASGFNLVSSVSDGDRRIVAVVMGGTSGGARDNQMAELIKTYLPKASTRGGGDLIAAARPLEEPAFAAAKLPRADAPMPEFRQDVDMAYATPAPLALPKAVKRPTAPVAAAPAPAGDTLAARMGDIDMTSTASVPSGWVIQVASSPSEVEARAILARTKPLASRLLDEASAFTVVFTKGGVTYYRARFGGFGSKTAAWDACSALKKQKVACYAVQQ